MRKIHYTWKKLVHFDGEESPRYITIHGDPMEYEFPFDFLWNSPKEAIEGLREAVEETGILDEEEAGELVLIKVTHEPAFALSQSTGGVLL